MSKPKSKDKIGKSIDGILGNLTIRGREEKKEESMELEDLKRRLAAYEKMGSLKDLQQERALLLAQKQQIREEIQQAVEAKEQLRQEHMKLQQLIEGKNKEVDSLFTEITRLNKDKESVIQELAHLKKDLQHQINQKQQQSGQKQTTTLLGTSVYEKDKQSYQPPAVIRQYCEQPEGKRKLTIHLREIEYQAILKASHHLHSRKGQVMDTITRALRLYISTDHYIDAEREVFLKAIHSVRSVLEQMGYSTEEIEKRLTSSAFE